MENSEAYSIIKALIEKNLLVIRHQEFIDWLYRLQSKKQITEKEIKDLLQLAHQLRIYDLAISEQLLTAINH